MGKRPGHCYRYQKHPPFTRKEYIHRQPGSRITIFDMGNRKAKFEVQLSLIALEKCQIRHTSLEAARITSNRVLVQKAGKDKFHLVIRPHPHHILRENKMITGAGADRVQDGMRRAFGKSVDRAARIRPNQPLITVQVNAPHIEAAKLALKRASYKFSTPTRIVVDYVADPSLRQKLGIA